MPVLLSLEDLRHGYGSLTAVDGVSLQVPTGGRHALIGPNGAGKTTLLNLVAGLFRPREGRILLDGRDITRWSVVRRARAGIGRTHQQPAVMASLSAWENLIVAGWRAHPHAQLVGIATGLLSELDLADCADVPAGRLSHGQRRLLEIAMALVGRPRLLLLDEPAAGLSPPEVARLTTLLISLPPTVAVLLIEHHLDLVYACADTITVLRAGQPVITGSPDEIRTSALARTAYLTAV